MASDDLFPQSSEDPVNLIDLLELAKENVRETQLNKIRSAYSMAEKLHAGQIRASGDPYISHPVAVAKILAALRMDEDTIIAALLHDVIEDCSECSPEEIIQKFGKDVYSLIEGVTKLKFKPLMSGSARSRATIESRRAAESLRKMLMAMAKDVRVMVIKLADRLHNMQTLDSLSHERRIRIANETHEIYAPLAGRLGIWQIKWQLEDLAFKYLHPKEFSEISDLVAKSRKQRESEIQEITQQLKARLQAKGINSTEIYGRPKHLYSIFNKIIKEGVDFDQILDLIAIRVLVDKPSDCYLVLGIVHDLWVPIPGLFYDYIAKPKSNGYQSLHTKVVGPHGEPLEVQIRTRGMHAVAEYGVAAHWAYKESDRESSDSKDIAKLRILRQQLFDWSSDSRTSSDFLKSISTDLFSEQVFVFTPKGDVIDLPIGSIPIDFAFRVHSALGLTVVGAKVNGLMVSLSSKLQNGDVVDLITRSNASPSLDWLELVQSANARNKIRAYFRKRNKQENAARGREALERELRSSGLEPRDYLIEEKLDALAATMYRCGNYLDLLAKVGEGHTSVQNIISKLRGTKQVRGHVDTIKTARTLEGKTVLRIEGFDTIMLRRAKCCDPIPGEEVVGYVTRGRGMIVHRRVCPNAMTLTANEPGRMTPLEWPPEESSYSVTLKIITINRQGLLMDITTVFGETRTNVSSAKIRTMPNQTAEILISIDVRSLVHLNMVMTKVSQFSDVISILRVFGKGSTK